MAITFKQIEEVKKLAYANLAIRDAEIDAASAAGLPRQQWPFRIASAGIETEDGRLSLMLDGMNGRRSVIDRYKLNGKVIAKAKLPKA